MFDDAPGLRLSGKDLQLVESALHSKQKILAVQAGAGSKAARENLHDLKVLLTRVNAEIEQSGGTCRGRFGMICWFRDLFAQRRPT